MAAATVDWKGYKSTLMCVTGATGFLASSAYSTMAALCTLQCEIQRMSMLQASPHGWHGAPSGCSSGIFVKKTIRVEVPVDKYPNFNFVGRLLGPRGNSLKRVEAATECRVLIRGRGSIKVPSREDMMRDKPGLK